MSTDKSRTQKRGVTEPVVLSPEDVEHIQRWAESATPEQVAAAMREKLRLEREAGIDS